jgi:signal transduction histidine kinase
MRERMRLLQGEARIGPSPIGGVRVTLAIPVPTAGEEVTA